MIRNESEIRVAVLAILVGVLALNGFAGCAIMVLIVLIPWKPFLVVSSYLAQPVVDWRVRKACERQEKGLMQIEQELESFLGGVKQNVGAPVSASAPLPSPVEEVAIRPTPSPDADRPHLKVFKPAHPDEPTFQKLPLTTPGVSAALAISAVIEEHVRRFPHGAFSNMNLEVERVSFSGESAEAFVRFKSPHVKELVISQTLSIAKVGGRLGS